MKKIITLSIVCLVSGQLFAQKTAASASKETKVQPVAKRVEAVAPAVSTTSIAPVAEPAVVPVTSKKVEAVTPAVAPAVAVNPVAPAAAEAVSIAPLTQAEITGTLADAAKVVPAKAAAIKAKEEAMKAANVAKQKGN